MTISIFIDCLDYPNAKGIVREKIEYYIDCPGSVVKKILKEVFHDRVVVEVHTPYAESAFTDRLKEILSELA